MMTTTLVKIIAPKRAIRTVKTAAAKTEKAAKTNRAAKREKVTAALKKASAVPAPKDAFKKARQLGLDLTKSTMAGVARSAILNGKTNDEVAAALKRAFPQFPAARHAYYPAWYRAQLVMKGVITAEFASENSTRE